MHLLHRCGEMVRCDARRFDVLTQRSHGGRLAQRGQLSAAPAVACLADSIEAHVGRQGHGVRVDLEDLQDILQNNLAVS